MEIINQSNIDSYVRPKSRLLVITQKFKPHSFYDFLSKITFGFYKKYFEYQTNPKDLNYLLERTWHLFFKLIENKNCLIHKCLLGFSKEGGLKPQDYLTALPENLKDYDILILIYPDSLGLGFKIIEDELLKYKKPIIVLNGRNRFFLFQSAKWRLYLHRVLEKYLFFEILFSIAFILTTPFYLPFSLFLPYKTRWKKTKISSQEYFLRQGEVKTADNVKEVEEFWDEKPMTYGDSHGKASYKKKEFVLYTKDFFKNVDKTFCSWNKPLHINKVPFSKIFDYERYKGKKVLEIGCGMGTMIMNWAQKGAQVSAVDLTEEAITQTKKRFELYNLKGEFKKSDARNLPFGAEQFDYVYSWGVLHHSPDLRSSLCEIERVLKKGGDLGIMLYNRDSFFHLFLTKFRQGFLHLENEFLSLFELASRYGDDYQNEGNPYTWPVKLDEINYLFDGFKDIRLKILGTDLDYVFWRTFPFVFFLIPKFVKKALARRYGWSLWITAKK